MHKSQTRHHPLNSGGEEDCSGGDDSGIIPTCAENVKCALTAITQAQFTKGLALGGSEPGPAPRA